MKTLNKFYLAFLQVMLVSSSFASTISAASLKQRGDLICHDEGYELLNAGQFEAAVEKFEEALSVHQTTGAKNEEAACLFLIGLSKDQLFDYEGALEAYRAALPLLQYVNELTQWTIVNHIGIDYRRLGQYQQAIEYYHQALEIAEKPGIPGAAKGATLNNMGIAYLALGQFEEARKSLADALPFREKGSEDEVNTLNNLGEVYRNMENYDQALDYYNQALEVAKNLDNPKLVGVIFNNLGLTYNEMGDYEQAKPYYEQALDIHREAKDKREIATTLNNLGKLYFETGEEMQAITYLEEALEIHKTSGDRAKKEIALTNLGYLYEQMGSNVQAIRLYQDSIAILESVQKEITVEELKTSFLGNNSDAYVRIVGVLWDEGRFEEAFDYAERARARAFLDQLAGGSIDFQAGAAANLLEQEKALQTEIELLHEQMIFLNNQVGTAVDQGAIDAVQTQLTQREADYEELLTKIKLQSPEVAGLVSVDIAKLTEIQNLLDPNTTLVDYFVTEDRTLAFLITHSSFETVALQVHAEDLNEAINTFRDDFAGLTNVHPSSLKQLYTWLILPLKDKLNTRLVGIIPHGTLHYVPFAALTDGEHYLSEEYALFTLPSASVLRFIQEKRKPTAATILAVGNPSTTEPGLPPLQSAEKEAQTIASLFGAQPLIGDSATESALRTQSPNAGIVHIAAHGKYNSSNPLFSTLFLAKDSEQDGRLQVQEIYSLDLTKTTDLVVLSACETQVGDVSAGDEVVGMTRAFLYAGTPTVIASLWKVDDEATTLLMERFYNHLREGMGKAQALQQAQRELREQYQQYRHPYYWAAFVLTGDPGEVVETNPAQPPTNARRIPPMAGMVGVLCLCLLSLLVVAPGIGVLVKKRWRQSA